MELHELLALNHELESGSFDEGQSILVPQVDDLFQLLPQTWLVDELFQLWAQYRC